MRDPEASAFFSRAETRPDPRKSEIVFNHALALIFEGKAAEALPSLTLRADLGAAAEARVRLLRVWALRMLNRESERSEEWEQLIALVPSFSSLALPDLARRLEHIFLSERTPGVP